VLEIVANNRLNDPAVAGMVLTSRDITERNRVEAALRAEQARLELLLQNARALTSSLDRAEILHALATRLITALHAAGAAVTEVDLTTRTVNSTTRVVTPGHTSFATNSIWEPLSNYPVLAQVLDTGQAWCGRVDDADCPASERAYLRRHGMTAEVLAPIVARGEAIAVLEVLWDQPERMAPDTLALCAAIADQAAVALEHARLYAVEAELRGRAETRARRIEQVQRVGEWLKSDLDEAEIARRIVGAACEASGFHVVVLNLVDEPRNPHAPWRVVETIGIPPEGIETLCAHTFTVADTQDLFRPEFRVSRSYFIPEESGALLAGTEVPRWTPEQGPTGANAWHAGDELLVPLTDGAGGQLIGFISVGEPEGGRRPEREDVELLELFADQAVVALRNVRQLARARRQAERDHVTGLFNHRAAHARLEHELAVARETGTPVGLLALDMDGFKLVNDTYGHSTGDLALRHVADLLGRCARGGDIAARLGGDEFILIVPGAAAAQSAEVAQRLLALSQDTPLHIDGVGAIPLRLSIGVASCPEDTDQPHSLLTIADTRLYEAKRGGRSVETGQRAEAAAGNLEGFDLLSALVTAVDNKDRYTREHSEQVAALACALAEEVGLSRDTVRALRLAGLLHDVGKIGVPARVLRKPGPLEPDEWEAMKQHASLSATLVRAVAPDPNVLAAVVHHHERWDGAGYPAGLAGADIPLLGRIMIVADAVSAMALDRPYRKGLPCETIIAEVRRGAGAQFDPALVDPCIAVCGRLLG